MFTYGIYLVCFTILRDYNCRLHQSFKFWYFCKIWGVGAVLHEEVDMDKTVLRVVSFQY